MIDAAFLQPGERALLRGLATDPAVPFAIVWLKADDDVLRTRKVSRRQSGNDASETDIDVLQKLQGCAQALSEEETAVAVSFLSGADRADFSANTTARDALAKLTKF